MGDTLDRTAQPFLHRLDRAIALLQRASIRFPCSQSLYPLGFGVLFELGDEIHDFADDRILEAGLVADRAEDNVADGAGHADGWRRKPLLLPFQVPGTSRRRQFVECSAEIRGITGAGRDRAKACQDPVPRYLSMLPPWCWITGT